MATETDHRSCGWTTSSEDEKPGLLYAVLPKMVRSRLRRLPSLRRSISQYGLESEPSTPQLSRRTSGLSDIGTPPPGYQSRASLSEPTSDYECDDGMPLRPLSACSSESPVENDSGIIWKFANQGLSLLNIAASEDKKSMRREGSSSASLSRQLYVHGVTYLLRGLPTELSTDERLGIWSAIPPDVQQIAPVTNTAIVVQPSNNGEEALPATGRAPLLQQCVASLIVQMFVITQFLLPYIKYCFAVLYKYERRHRISERLLASGVQSCEGMMRTGLQLSDAVCKVNGGRVGAVLNDLSIWWITGISAGIQQGVGDGLSIVNAQRTSEDAVESRKTR